MLLTFQGYFKSGHFVALPNERADTQNQIPEGRKTIITVLDEKIDKENEQGNYRAYWNKIIEDIQNSKEALEGEPERVRFRTHEEFAIL